MAVKRAAKKATTQKKDDGTRAAVMSALLEGQGVTAVANDFNISKATVSRIKKEIDEGLLKQLETEKRKNIGELVGRHLETSLEAAATLAEKVSTNDTWFIKQSASDIAVLYGVLTDKAIRILEAAERAQSGNSNANGNA